MWQKPSHCLDLLQAIHLQCQRINFKLCLLKQISFPLIHHCDNCIWKKVFPFWSLLMYHEVMVTSLMLLKLCLIHLMATYFFVLRHCPFITSEKAPLPIVVSISYSVTPSAPPDVTYLNMSMGGRILCASNDSSHLKILRRGTAKIKLEYPKWEKL